MARVGARGVATALVAAVLVAAVLVGVLLTRPDAPVPAPPTTTERRAIALADALGRPGGSEQVDVGAGHDQHGYDYVATVVTLARAATAGQVAEIITGLPASVRRVGLPATYAFRKLTFVTAGGARLSVAWQPSVDAVAVQRAVAGWLAVATAVGDDVDVAGILLTDGEISYRLTLGASPDSAGGTDLLGVYRRAAAQVAREPSADQTRVQWDLSGTAGPTSLRLASTGPLDSAEQQEWSAVLASSRLVRGPLSTSRVEMSFRDRVEAHLAVLAPDDVDDAAFTPASYGADVWPAVRPQLRRIAGDSGGTGHWSYFLSWAHRSRPGTEQLLALLFGDQAAVRDGTGKDRSPDASAGWAGSARRFLAEDDGGDDRG